MALEINNLIRVTFLEHIQFKTTELQSCNVKGNAFPINNTIRLDSFPFYIKKNSFLNEPSTTEIRRKWCTSNKSNTIKHIQPVQFLFYDSFLCIYWGPRQWRHAWNRTSPSLKAHGRTIFNGGPQLGSK